MRPYSYEYGSLVHDIKNTSSFRNSRILSTNWGGIGHRPYEGQTTGHWQYVPRWMMRYEKKICDDDRQEDDYVAAKKSSTMKPHPDAKQKQIKDLKNTLRPMSPLQQFDNKLQPPSKQCIHEKSFITISPEFVELLKKHDLRKKENNMLRYLPENDTKILFKPRKHQYTKDLESEIDIQLRKSLLKRSVGGLDKNPTFAKEKGDFTYSKSLNSLNHSRKSNSSCKKKSCGTVTYLQHSKSLQMDSKYDEFELESEIDAKLRFPHQDSLELIWKHSSGRMPKKYSSVHFRQRHNDRNLTKKEENNKNLRSELVKSQPVPPMSLEYILSQHRYLDMPKDIEMDKTKNKMKYQYPTPRPPSSVLTPRITPQIYPIEDEKKQVKTVKHRKSIRYKEQGLENKKFHNFNSSREAMPPLHQTYPWTKTQNNKEIDIKSQRRNHLSNTQPLLPDLRHKNHEKDLGLINISHTYSMTLPFKSNMYLMDHNRSPLPSYKDGEQQRNQGKQRKKRKQRQWDNNVTDNYRSRKRSKTFRSPLVEDTITKKNKVHIMPFKISNRTTNERNYRVPGGGSIPKGPDRSAKELYSYENDLDIAKNMRLFMFSNQERLRPKYASWY